MTLRVLLAATTAIVLPGLAMAQMTPVMSSTITLGYSSSTIDALGTDIDLSTTTLDVDTDTRFGDNINVALDFGISSTDIDISGVPIGIQADLMSFEFEPSYHFANGAYVGLYYRSGDLDLSISGLPITFGVDTHQTGIFAGYESGPFGLEAFYGTSDTDPSLPGNIDITDYGVSLSYDIAANFEVFGSYTRSEIDLTGASIDLSLYAIGAEYSFTNGLAVYGSIGGLDVDTPLPVNISASQIAIGLSYDLANAGSSFPAIVSLDLAHTELDVGPLPTIDSDRISLGLTIPLGPNASHTPRNSPTQIARGEYRSAISGTLAALR